ncbi:MAG: hypothetical protein CME06_05860 [Gemmatimonadetes bacterium]|nr:hypothetical protein [Gemmatimonadota bacterium]
MNSWRDSANVVLAAGESLSLWGPVLRVFAVTAAFVILLFVIRRWLPVLAPNALSKLRSQPFAEVLGRQFLGPRKALLLVRVEGRRFLLSETGDGFRLVTELEDDPDSFGVSLRQATGKDAN